MPNTKPIFDLRNYTEVLHDVAAGDNRHSKQDHESDPYAP